MDDSLLYNDVHLKAIFFCLGNVLTLKLNEKLKSILNMTLLSARKISTTKTTTNDMLEAFYVFYKYFFSIIMLLFSITISIITSYYLSPKSFRRTAT